MKRPEFTAVEGMCVAGGMLAVASADGRTPSAAQRSVIDGLASLLLADPDLRS
jgi:hypothetical protein